MALTEREKIDNQGILYDLVLEQFRAVKNQEEMLVNLLRILNANAISLRKYYSAPVFKKILDAAVASAVTHNQFTTQAAEANLKAAAESIRDIEAQERRAYVNQAPELNIINQLRTKRYVDVGHLLTHGDIGQFLDKHFAGNQRVELAAPVSLADDNGRALADIFAAHKLSNKLLIVPINLNNSHWTLLYGEPKTGKFTLWDPLPGRGTPPAKAQVEQAANTVGFPVSVTHIYAGEQHDGTSCGLRIAQKALKVAGLNTPFTAIATDDVSALAGQFVTELVGTTPGLNTNTIGMVNDEQAPLLYLGAEDNPAIKDVVETKKQIQESSDEVFAVILQDIYMKDASISEPAAIIAAKQMLSNISFKDLEEMKARVAASTGPKLASWMEQLTAARSSAGFFAKNCRQEAASDEVNQQTSTLVS